MAASSSSVQAPRCPDREGGGPSLDEEDEFEEVTFENAGHPSSGTTLTKGNRLLVTLEPEGQTPVQLPTGVTSVRRWGQTLCTLPKLAALKLAYHEIVVCAGCDKNIKPYIENFVLKYNGPSARVNDLKGYLMAVMYSSSDIVYDGSTDIRTFKED